MRRRPGSRWIAAVGVPLACAGCGFKGPLYLPERNATVVTHSAPAAQGVSPQGQPQAPAGKDKHKSPPPASPPTPPSPPAA
jgi:predicted small lipoprotein YifL